MWLDPILSTPALWSGGVLTPVLGLAGAGTAHASQRPRGHCRELAERQGVRGSPPPDGDPQPAARLPGDGGRGENARAGLSHGSGYRRRGPSAGSDRRAAKGPACPPPRALGDPLRPPGRPAQQARPPAVRLHGKRRGHLAPPCTVPRRSAPSRRPALRTPRRDAGGSGERTCQWGAGQQPRGCPPRGATGCCSCGRHRLPHAQGPGGGLPCPGRRDPQELWARSHCWAGQSVGHPRLLEPPEGAQCRGQSLGLTPGWGGDPPASCLPPKRGESSLSCGPSVGTPRGLPWGRHSPSVRGVGG